MGGFKRLRAFNGVPYVFGLSGSEQNMEGMKDDCWELLQTSPDHVTQLCKIQSFSFCFSFGTLLRAQGLLLTLCPGISPGSAQGSVVMLGNKLGVFHVRFLHCLSSPNTTIIIE